MLTDEEIEKYVEQGNEAKRTRAIIAMELKQKQRELDQVEEELRLKLMTAYNWAKMSAIPALESIAKGYSGELVSVMCKEILDKLPESLRDEEDKQGE